MIVGFFSGLLMDIFYGSTIGGFAFLYMMFGFVDGFFHRIYYSDDNILPLVLIGVNDLVYGVIMYILCGLLHNSLYRSGRSCILSDFIENKRLVGKE